MSDLFKTAPAPKSLLGYHRILSPSAGVRVSPLCLGGANFGDSMKDMLGECSKETCFAILDEFWEQGGNFIDTANNYQAEQSETWIGEWMESRQNRDEIVLATKFTNGWPSTKQHIKSNFQGNHAKSLKLSVKASCAKLKTDYIDLLYVHYWDYTTGVSEMMNALHHLVASGKVLYLGISDCPAWVVVKCNDYARFHGLTPFCVYQGNWSCAVRDFEREILPMCQDQGMGIAPFGTLGQGMLKTREEYDNPDREGRKVAAKQPEKYIRIAEKLSEIAQRKHSVISNVALAYVLHKAPYVFPIVGGRKVEHLKSNIEALSLELSREEVQDIEDAYPFDVGWPQSFFFGAAGNYHTDMKSDDIQILSANWRLETVPSVRPIAPRQGERKFAAKGQ